MLTNRFFLTVFTGMALFGLTGCDTNATERMALETNAHFWQRASVSEATYMEGPKAQQMLHRDIARCVNELKELEHLGTLRTVVPAETMINGEVPDPQSPEGSMAQWETPERDGYLRAEFLNYSDFETCMQSKGWDRLEHMPYDVAERARETYVETIMHEKYRTKSGERDQSSSEPEGDWDHLND